MSSSFDVYPSTAFVPTAGELEDEIARLLLLDGDRRVTRTALAGHDLTAPAPRCEIVAHGEPLARLHDPTAPLTFGGMSRLGVTLPGTRADVPLQMFDSGITPHHGTLIEARREDIAARGATTSFDFESAKGIGWSWDVSIELPQPFSGRLLTGYVVAALARLTGGLIDSFDGAGDATRLPCEPDDLLSWYPEWLDEQYRDVDTSPHPG